MRMTNISLASLIVTRLIIFPWQLIGLFRAIEQDYIERGNILKTRGLQAIALLSVLFTLVYALEVMQRANYYSQKVVSYSGLPTPLDYTIELSEDRQQLSISGALDIGITSAIRSILEAYPEISSVILQSTGGQIYEGRGLAKLFIEHKLDTYVNQECSSACSTAFIGGHRRYLSTSAKLGFHQYKIERKGYQQLFPFVDLGAEQKRDLALYKSRGVKQAFLDKMFDQPASRIWFPDHVSLRDARVIHFPVPSEQ